MPLGFEVELKKRKWSLAVLLVYKCMQNLDDAHVIKCFDIMTLDNNNRRNVALEHQFMVDRLIFLNGITDKKWRQNRSPISTLRFSQSTLVSMRIESHTKNELNE